ncbi:MAG: sn-glycerol-3-phosphate ABC transporter ATP-binding protein UgpC [Gemmatimonadales bacterium]|jgi:multiple sugar transport system ATP-binding protein
MAQVSLQNLTKKFDDTIAVADLNLDVGDGEFVVLVGPSGSGKTTALRLIAGLERPTHGSIRIGERDVTDVPPRDRDIAMVFQNYALYPHMSVYENMAFGLRARGHGRQEIGTRVKEAAEILGIDTLLHRKPSQLSGGQRQRTAVGRSIVRHPQVFLFDEPLSNLDASLRVEMRAELSQLHRRLNATIIYVTHDQVEAMTMGQRIAVMNDGQLQQYATPLEIYRQPANVFVAGFIGSPSINLFSGQLAPGKGDWRFTGDAFDLRIASQKEPPAGTVTLGVRPEDLRIEDRQATLQAEVRVVEPIGSEMFVHLTSTGESRVITRAPADTQISVDQRVYLEIPPDKVHLFRSDTGDRIEP